MANEATVRSQLTITKDSLEYSSRPAAFTADVSGVGGPTPGLLSIPTTGEAVDLGELTTPGFCRVQNLDSTNYVDLGIRDPDSNKFYPLIRLLPGETFVFRLSPDVGGEYGTGTGTVGPSSNQIYLKANNAACKVLFEAFEA